KAPPNRSVLQEAMPGELLGEELLAIGDGRVLVRGREAGALEGLVGALDDEGRAVLGVAIGVDLKEAMRAALEVKGECTEWKRRPQPDESVRADVDRRPEMLGKLGSEQAVGAVGNDHEIGAAERRERGDLALERELYAELGRAALEDAEERLARQAAETVTG